MEDNMPTALFHALRQISTHFNCVPHLARRAELLNLTTVDYTTIDPYEIRFSTTDPPSCSSEDADSAYASWQGALWMWESLGRPRT